MPAMANLSMKPGGCRSAASRRCDLAVFVHAVELEQEDVLEGDGVAFHAAHFGDVRDLARAVLEAR